jgi:proline iminopeptidase
MYDELTGVISHYKTNPMQKVFLLGHSWGGILASGYAGKYPNAIQGLVVGEPGGLEYKDIVDYVSASRSFKLWSEMLNDASYLDQFITGKEDQHEILDYKLALLASKNEITGEDNTAPGSTWRSGAVINTALNEIGEEYEPDFSQGIDQLEVPVLLLYSENNKAYPDDWAQKISAAYTTAELYKVKGVGHNGIVSDDYAWTNLTLPRILSYFNTIQ